MSAAYSSRDIVEDFLRDRLLRSGLTWRPGGGPRSGGAGPRPGPASRRSERAVTSRRSAALQDDQQGPGSAPPRLQVVLRCAGEELERRYRGDLAAHVSMLLLGDGGRAERRRGLDAVGEELFRDGVNWGRIVAMMELGGALSAEELRRGGAWQVDVIAAWMEESLDSPPLRGWIEDNGGWDSFVQLYGQSGPPLSYWSLMVFGLAVLGAAWITLGALFTQR